MTDSEIITLIRSSPEKGYRALVKIYGNYVYAVVMNRVSVTANLNCHKTATSD